VTVPPLRFGPGGEFELIRRMVGEHTLPPGVLVGPGDDAAVLEGGWVVSTDVAVEGVHFRREWLTSEEIGYRAAAAGLSDLAAMASRPVAILLSLVLPAEEATTLGPALQAGARRAADLVGAGIIGGDVSGSPGPVVMDVVALGRATSPVLRRGGRPGDELWVTGTLGGAGGAVRMWGGGRSPMAGLREAFASPRPRVAEALWLSELGVLRAALDLSDGLAGDAGHLAAAGGLRIRLETDALPLHPELLSGDFSRQDAVRLALHGGEDYELAFLAPPGSVAAILPAFRERFGIPLTCVGRAEEGEGVVLGSGEALTRPGRGPGFSHFGSSHFEDDA
jgi:thiamine-monophosphate kinase